jgi:uncharacterized hydrophobic protein (TIGR00271 family)
MLSVAPQDLERMRAALFFEGPDQPRRLSRFWILLVLAAIIATAGVSADSTATVIGAMIVAPLMTPILGIVLAVALGDRRNLVWSVALVVSGAVVVVTVAWLFGQVSAVDALAPTNTQVAGRISPRAVDLIAALATGAVGAFALVRDDIGDTLPGVAIAISLVPPLAVVGLTLEAGAPDQARGALLLFLTNVAAILVSGTVVMALYRVRRTALSGAVGPSVSTVGTRYPVLAIAALVVIVAIPLLASGQRYRTSAVTTQQVSTIARDWARTAAWDVASVEYRDGLVVVRAVGPEPAPDPAALRRSLDRRGQADTDVRVELLPEERYDLPARGAGLGAPTGP